MICKQEKEFSCLKFFQMETTFKTEFALPESILLALRIDDKKRLLTEWDIHGFLWIQRAIYIDLIYWIWVYFGYKIYIKCLWLRTRGHITFSCPIQLSMDFVLPIKIKMRMRETFFWTIEFSMGFILVMNTDIPGFAGILLHIFVFIILDPE